MINRYGFLEEKELPWMIKIEHTIKDSQKKKDKKKSKFYLN